ncbi:hypothetical protein DFJ77DRAFT_550566 [Powellomyces hirtus]|nr:hypothetical protein DFJ77DRAFT_550566 [Powellomyces hirtus]
MIFEEKAAGPQFIEGTTPSSTDYAQLCEQLRHCMALLEEKDRDLLLAAEVGQLLLQQNEQLSSVSCQQCASLRSNKPHITTPPRDDSSAAPPLDMKNTENPFLSPSMPKTPEPTMGEKTSRSSSPLMGYCASPRRPRSQEFKWPGSPVNKRTPKQRIPSATSDFEMSDYVVNLEQKCADFHTQVVSLQAQLREETHSQQKEKESAEAAVSELRTALSAVTEEVESLREEKRRLLRQMKNEKREKSWYENEDRDNVASLIGKVQEAEEEATREAAARQAVENRLKTLLEETGILRQRVSELGNAVKENVALNMCCERQEKLIAELKEQLEEMRVNYTNATMELDSKATPLLPGLPESIEHSDADEAGNDLPVNAFKELASARCSERGLPGAWQDRPGSPIGQIYDRVTGLGGGLASHTPSPPATRLPYSRQYLSPIGTGRSLRSEMASGVWDSDNDDDQVFLTPRKSSIASTDESPVRSRRASRDRSTSSRGRRPSIDLFLPPSPALSALARRGKTGRDSPNRLLRPPSEVAIIDEERTMDSQYTSADDGLLNGGTALLSMLWKFREWVVTG